MYLLCQQNIGARFISRQNEVSLLRNQKLQDIELDKPYVSAFVISNKTQLAKDHYLHLKKTSSRRINGRSPLPFLIICYRLNQQHLNVFVSC